MSNLCNLVYILLREFSCKIYRILVFSRDACQGRQQLSTRFVVVRLCRLLCSPSKSICARNNKQQTVHLHHALFISALWKSALNLYIIFLGLNPTAWSKISFRKTVNLVFSNSLVYLLCMYKYNFHARSCTCWLNFWIIIIICKSSYQVWI